MRFRALELRAYGPFTDLRLDFGRGPADMHVLYGNNEAGKSTALRAITGLLFGMGHTTRDAHKHKPADLRVAASLEDEQGRELAVVRRKGLKSTLLGPDGAAIDEAPLRRLLGGATEGMFRTMFGLDHETLRHGAEALLEGKGDVGESLFGAGFGGSRLHGVLEELRAEAAEIFTPQGRNQKLPAVLRLFADAQKTAQNEALAPEAYLSQQRARDEAIAFRARHDEEARELAVKQNRLLRAQRALPLVAQRRAVLARRAAFHGMTMVAESVTRDREDAVREIAGARSQIDTLSAEVAELSARRSATHVPRSLLDDKEAMGDLGDRLGGHRKAAADLPKLEAELGVLEQSREVHAASQILARMSVDHVAHASDPVMQARVRELSLEQGALREKLRLASRAEVEARARLEQISGALGRMPASRDSGLLADAVVSARAEGDLGARLRRAAAEVGIFERRVENGLANLGLWRGSGEDLAKLPVPPLETIDRFERELALLARRREKIEETASAERAKGLDFERELDALRRAGHVPTEEELAASRAERDRLWHELRAARANSATWSEGSADSFAGAMRRSDDLADRLRREAERVTRLGRLRADREACRASLVASEAALRDLAEREQAKQAEWEASFAPSGITPRPPEEMARWAQARTALVEIIDQLAKHRSELAVIEQVIAARRAAIVRAFVDLGEACEAPPRGIEAQIEDFAALVQRAARGLEGVLAEGRRRDEATLAMRALEAEVASLERTHVEARADMNAWTVAWKEAIVAIGLGAVATPEEAVATLQEIERASKLADKRDELARRVRGIERDRLAFEADVRRMARLHAPDLAVASAETAAVELQKRFRQGIADQVSLDEIERQLADKMLKLEEQRRREDRARAALAACFQAANARDLAELEEAEQRSRQARALDAKAIELEDRLLHEGEGATVEALEVELATIDADGLAAEIDAAREAAAELEERRRKNDVRIGALEAGLQQYDGAPKAAEAAAMAEAHLTRARELGATYARARFAVALLEAEIERYREANQGPIVARASELFRRLTLGSIDALRTDYDDQDRPVLACTRPGGAVVGVEALSDGTRDQLYLALRLATIERHAQSNPPMPLVVDDILIHFDDDRARAALAVLGELAARAQVLFFTHHERLVDLAKEAIDASRLVVHALR